jgi:hypothetical protein
MDKVSDPDQQALDADPDTENDAVTTMDEGRERDNTSRKGGLPTLPGLYRSTFQPSQRGFFMVHVCKGRESWRKPI